MPAAKPIKDKVDVLNEYARSPYSQRKYVNWYNKEKPAGDKKDYLQTINQGTLSIWVSNALEMPAKYPGLDLKALQEKSNKFKEAHKKHKADVLREWVGSGLSQSAFVGGYNAEHSGGTKLSTSNFHRWVNVALEEPKESRAKDYPGLNFSDLEKAHARFAKKAIQPAAGAPVLAGPSRAPLDNACVSYADPARLVQMAAVSGPSAVPGGGVVLPSMKELFGDIQLSASSAVPGGGVVLPSMDKLLGDIGQLSASSAVPDAAGGLPSLSSLDLTPLPAGSTSPAQQTVYRSLQGNTARPAGPSRGR